MRISDWSSDVCSSDLCAGIAATGQADRTATMPPVGSISPRWEQPARAMAIIPVNANREKVTGNPLGTGVGLLIHSPSTTQLKLHRAARSEEHTSELQSLMRISYAVFCLKKKNTNKTER